MVGSRASATMSPPGTRRSGRGKRQMLGVECHIDRRGTSRQVYRGVVAVLVHDIVMMQGQWWGPFASSIAALRNIGGLLSSVAVDVGGQAIAKGEEIGRIGGGVAVDVVLVADVQNCAHPSRSVSASFEVTQQRRENVVCRPEAAGSAVGVVVEDDQVDVCYAGSSLAGLASFSARFPSAVPVWPAPQPDAGRRCFLDRQLHPDGVRDALGPSQERHNLLRAVSLLRLIRAVVRRAGEELGRRVGGRDQRHQIHDGAAAVVVPVTTAVDRLVAATRRPRARQEPRRAARTAAGPRRFVVLTGHGSPS